MKKSDVYIEARFSAFTVNTFAEDNIADSAGTYTKLHNKKVSVGEKVALSATVNDGYNFEGWFIDGVCVSRNLNYDYTMERGDAEICAKYSAYKITTIGYAMGSHGDTDASFTAGTYTKYNEENISAGRSVTLTATVNDGYNFVGWFIDDACVETGLEYSFEMKKSDVEIRAIYSYYVLNTSAKYTSDYYKDFANTNAHSVFDSYAMYITPAYTDKRVSVGTSVTVEATDIEGYTFYAWRTADAILSHDKSYTFTMKAGDLELYALYVEN